MIIDNLEHIRCNITKEHKIMSLDISKNNIGIGICDATLSIAFPHTTIKRTNQVQDFTKINEIIKKNNIFAIIIGLPLEKDGTSKARVQSIKTFAINLMKHIDTIIYFQDERYSTYFIENNNYKNNKNDIDSQSAAWFLQIVLDKISIKDYLKNK